MSKQSKTKMNLVVIPMIFALTSQSALAAPRRTKVRPESKENTAEKTTAPRPLSVEETAILNVLREVGAATIATENPVDKTDGPLDVTIDGQQITLNLGIYDRDVERATKQTRALSRLVRAIVDRIESGESKAEIDTLVRELKDSNLAIGQDVSTGLMNSELLDAKLGDVARGAQSVFEIAEIMNTNFLGYLEQAQRLSTSFSKLESLQGKLKEIKNMNGVKALLHKAKTLVGGQQELGTEAKLFMNDARSLRELLTSKELEMKGQQLQLQEEVESLKKDRKIMLEVVDQMDQRRAFLATAFSVIRSEIREVQASGNPKAEEIIKILVVDVMNFIVEEVSLLTEVLEGTEKAIADSLENVKTHEQLIRRFGHIITKFKLLAPTQAAQASTMATQSLMLKSLAQADAALANGDKLNADMLAKIGAEIRSFEQINAEIEKTKAAAIIIREKELETRKQYEQQALISGQEKARKYEALRARAQKLRLSLQAGEEARSALSNTTDSNETVERLKAQQANILKAAGKRPGMVAKGIEAIAKAAKLGQTIGD